MPILAFNPEQLLVLSSAARTRPEEASPLRRLYLQIPPRMTPNSPIRALEELAAAKMIVANDEGRPRLAKRLEPVFYVLHRPERVIGFSRPGRRDLAEAFFCRRGKLWVQDAVSATEEVELILWPFDDASMGRWFAEELLGDLVIEPGALKETHAKLSVPEWTVLLALQEVYRRKVLATGAPVRDEALWVDRRLLASPEVLDAVHTVSGVFLSRERLGEAMADDALLDGLVARLMAARLLFGKEGLVAFTRRAQSWFDPGRVQAVVAVSSYGPRVDAKLVYVLKDGWLIVEPAGGETPRLLVRAVPGTVSRAGVFARIMEGLA